MDERNHGGTSHFALVTHGQRFLMRALPLDDVDSGTALAEFIHQVSACKLPTPVVDAVLLRCLSVLDRHAGGMLPTLVERYLAQGDLGKCAGRFERCVADVLRYRGIANRG